MQAFLSPRRAAALLAALPCVILGVWLLADAGALRQLRSAERAGASGDFAAAASVARGIHREPAATRARLVEAYALRASGRRTAALRAFRRAVAADPARASIRRDLGALLLEMGDRRGARSELALALALDPGIALPAGVQATPRQATGRSR